MQPEFAAAVAVGIAVALFVVWLFALRAMLGATRERQAISDDDAQAMGTEPSAATISGSAEVAGAAEALSARLAEKLARDGLGFLGPVKITSADRREVSFEALGGPPGAGGPASVALRRGGVRFSASGNKTRVEYHVEAGSGRVLLGLGWLFIAFGLAAIVIGLALEFAFVINSPQEGTRTQAVQMLQAVHLIWPPFLFAQLSRQPIRAIRNQFDAMINNLPYT